ncbi:hypothetical protein PMAYCL1PPCAC_26945 [Pristionchus mayeri]|uniref:Epoxide hydrolase n=1 Tax=Pristionchus mayeri TaxID=1317129 RepID=A0AAN5D670_9BILA|nr:hypothetical protein PMAYCL1PPCAC_26945 [Pristionchus mayeri]
MIYLIASLIVAGVIIAIAVLVGARFFYLSFVNKKTKPPQDGWYGKGDKRADDTGITPFKVAVPEGILEDLKERLGKTRISHEVLEDSDNFEYGFNGNYLKEVVNYWRENFDWRKQEQILNSWPQYTTEVEGVKIHYYHAKPDAGKYKEVVPLLLVHGWPGNVFEFYKMIPMLIDPEAHGVKSSIAFQVIAPSIPGYGFSEAPSKKGFSPCEAARVFKKLMQRVGHNKFYLQGGDWGAVITTQLARMYPESVFGLHTNMLTANPLSIKGFFYTFVGSIFSWVTEFLKIPQTQILFKNPHQHGYNALQAVTQVAWKESGYMHIQGTKPDTVGTGLNDSPVGLAAYILEKFSVWTNPDFTRLRDGGLTKKFTLDELLTVITIYWTQGNIVSSQRFYKEFFMNPLEFWLTLKYVTVPTGHAQFPNEIFDKQPAEIVETSYNLITQKVMPDGGHFPAFEQPTLLAGHLFSFVQTVEKCA